MEYISLLLEIKVRRYQWGKSITANLRRTDNTMCKRKSTNGETMIFRILCIIQKIKHHQLPKNRVEIGCSGRVSSSCSTGAYCRITVVTNRGNKLWMRTGPEWNVTQKPVMIVTAFIDSCKLNYMMYYDQYAVNENYYHDSNAWTSSIFIKI